MLARASAMSGGACDMDLHLRQIGLQLREAVEHVRLVGLIECVGEHEVGYAHAVPHDELPVVHVLFQHTAMASNSFAGEEHVAGED